MTSTSATTRSAPASRSPVPLALLDPDSPHVGHRVDVIPVCWGYGGAGELGDGTTGQRRLPRLVLGGLHFREVIAGIGPGGGYGSSCGVTTLDRAYCWGANGRGQLGDGTTITRPRR